MHPKNPFNTDYDFDFLIKHYPALKEFVFKNKYGNVTIQFSSKEAINALNTALIKSYYQIDWNIPNANLCPPIPGRLDYLFHIADLIPKQTLKLLDIGTGANLIYPILATCHFNWDCTASEVALTSLEHAQAIIDQNTALQTITLRHQNYKNHILEHIIQPKDKFDVVVCNPPFFKSRADAQKRNQRKVKNLKLNDKEPLNFGGQSHELWYKGGEEAFIKKMATESALFKRQVQWFTALVSQKDHLKNIKRAINKTQPTEVRIIEMAQGNKQSRCIAWTFE
ncbi:MAG: 23S rRNA (adenine(1618)-N(6))-methyltransferase RlmF [Flavobacteriaceae bacterium]|nr:23S rRNA (adenine(1618)-N(6))-methyltransferase RlmF [Flavobacteriaceae bacterium]